MAGSCALSMKTKSRALRNEKKLTKTCVGLNLKNHLRGACKIVRERDTAAVIIEMIVTNRMILLRAVGQIAQIHMARMALIAVTGGLAVALILSLVVTSTVYAMLRS